MARNSKILRYPIKPPVADVSGADDVESPTEFIDYLSLRRYQIDYSDKATSYYGQNLPGNSVKKSYGSDTRVYLALPNSIETSYQPQYSQVDLGVGGIAAAGLVGTSGGLDSIVNTVTDFAGSAGNEFVSSAIAGAANNVSQMLGLAGNLDANSLQSLTTGKVFNPFQEQIFKNMQFRTHSFNFKLFARSAQEAAEIYDIIQWIKIGAVPKIGAASSSGLDKADLSSFESQLTGSDSFKKATNARFFEVPDKFEISYKRMQPDKGSGRNGLFLHHRIKDSVCAGIKVNFTPDGSYNAFRSFKSSGNFVTRNNFGQIHVPSVTLALQFIETSIITLDDVLEGF